MSYLASIESRKSSIMSLNERLEALSQSDRGPQSSPEFQNSGTKNSGINSGSSPGSSVKNTDKADTMKYVSAKFMVRLLSAS